jgi:hypothetical protein
MSSSGSGTVINYGSGSGSDFLTSYGSGYGSGSTTLEYWNFLETSRVHQLFHLLGIDYVPDRHALDADADPNPAKYCGSDPIRIRIQNTDNRDEKLRSRKKILN